MDEEGVSFEDGPMIVFADEEMMEEIYEESNEIVATFLPMVSEEEELKGLDLAEHSMEAYADFSPRS